MLDRFDPSPKKRSLVFTSQVIPTANRCIQCGICSHDCPSSIDVRRHVWLDEPVIDSYCLSCGECIERCPRGLLQFVESARVPIKRAPIDHKSSRRHVIIGAGPAAVAAAQTVRSLDSTAHITLIAADPSGYYSRPGLAYYLVNYVPADLLFPFKRSEFAEQDLHLVTDTVEAIDRANRTVRLASGTTLEYDRLLIATGASTITPDIPGSDLDGVVALDNMQDARDIVARSRQASSAVVLGGGTIAIEMAEGLRAQRVDVHYLMRGERYWPDVLSESESRIIERRLASRGIRLHPRTEIARILGSGGRVVGVETTDGTRIACEIVGVSIGVAPNKSLAEAVGLECGRGVLVDDRMQTSEPDIFAAGDVAETIGSDERPTLETLWNSAVAQGRVAGANMATEATARQPESVALNVTQLAGLKCMFIGTIGNGPMEDLKSLARGDSDIWRRLPDTTRLEFEGDHSHVRLELLGNRIVGAVVVGEQKPAYQLQAIVVAQADVSSILDELKRQDISSARALERFAEEWRGPQHVQA